jgi:hypothetical protein
MKIFCYLPRYAIRPHVLFVAVIILLSFACGAKAVSNEEVEHNKIMYLLDTIASSDLVFIRNGVEYNGKEARDHLQEKMDDAGDSIHTAEDFINDIGSESSTTGLSYYVRFADGTQVEAGIWLHNKLAEIK